MSYDAHANVGPIMLIGQIIMIVLAISSVVLRFLARKLSGAGLWWDDWMILAALPCILGQHICNFIGIHLGLGQHAIVLPINATSQILHIGYSEEVLYHLDQGLVKYSILLFYRRIFPQRELKYLLWAVATVVFCWQISIGATFLFQCTPIHRAWDVFSPGTCIDVNKAFLGAAIPNMITDLIIIVIPLPLIWKLHVSRSQRIALCGVFLTGGFVCAVSFIRLIIIVHIPYSDFPWNWVGLAIWSIVEPNVGLICACLPSLRFFLKGFTTRLSKLSSHSSKNPTPPARAHRHAASQSETEDFTGLNGAEGDVEGFTNDIRKGSASEAELEMGIPMNAIHVRNEVAWTDSERELSHMDSAGIQRGGPSSG